MKTREITSSLADATPRPTAQHADALPGGDDRTGLRVLYADFSGLSAHRRHPGSHSSSKPHFASRFSARRHGNPLPRKFVVVDAATGSIFGAGDQRMELLRIHRAHAWVHK